MRFEIYGVDLLDVFFRGTHALMAAAWLLFDFLVFWLHFDVKDPTIPLERRLERAHIMHRIDQIVGLIFLLMLPSGIILCYVTDTALFSTTWLNWKHFLFAIIIIDALILIPISGTALRNLEAIRGGAKNVDELNHEIRHNMNRAMPAVFLIWALVFGLSVLSLLNLKNPQDQEYFFRRTAAEQQTLVEPGLGAVRPASAGQADNEKASGRKARREQRVGKLRTNVVDVIGGGSH